MTEIERVKRKMERLRAGIIADEEQYARLQQQLEELENTEIIKLVRAKRISFLELKQFMADDPQRTLMSGEKLNDTESEDDLNDEQE